MSRNTLLTGNIVTRGGHNINTLSFPECCSIDVRNAFPASVMLLYTIGISIYYSANRTHAVTIVPEMNSIIFPQSPMLRPNSILDFVHVSYIRQRLHRDRGCSHQVSTTYSQRTLPRVRSEQDDEYSRLPGRATARIEHAGSSVRLSRRVVREDSSTCRCPKKFLERGRLGSKLNYLADCGRSLTVRNALSTSRRKVRSVPFTSCLHA